VDSFKELWHKYPWAVGGAIFLVGAIVIYYLFRGGSSAAASSDPNGFYSA
jgi:hypothetical protein